MFDWFWDLCKVKTEKVSEQDEKEYVETRTPDETEFYVNHRLPCCGSKEFFEGAQGGMNTNIKCAECGAMWNIEPTVFQSIERIGK